MKRSEMIKKIKSIIATRGPTQPTIDTAQQVLDMLEEEGILPPKAWVVTNPDNPHYPELHDYKELVNLWEPEDEI
jgi:hypothetical protein